MINKVILVGNAGKDPEVNTTAGGVVVAKFSVATSSSRKVGDEWQETTEWHNIVCFDKTAESVGKVVTKGRQVYVEGRLQTRKWEDKDGNKRSTTEIVAERVRALGPRGEKPADAAPSYEGTGADPEIPF